MSDALRPRPGGKQVAAAPGRRKLLRAVLSAGLAFGASACGAGPSPVAAMNAAIKPADDGSVQARVVATGIPGAGAICEVGSFLPGSPFHDNAAFVATTKPGKVLAPSRLLVASTSNFGAQLGNANDYPGTILSIDPSGSTVAVPSDFATPGGQASTPDGRAQVYTANNAAFANSVYHSNVVTAAYTGASLPTGSSLNSGNGRPWFSNAPTGDAGEGTITVIDPNGAPLKGAPDPVAGGIFAGTETDRNNNVPAGRGLYGTLGTAIFTKSPDLTGRAVFAAVNADGSVVQVHVQFGVSDLAPAGTVTPVTGVSQTAMESSDPSVVAREGILFNWAPTQNLIIADPQANRLVVLDISDDGTLFHAAAPRYINADAFAFPIDITPTTRETAAANFASNTTLGVGSDIYVLNRNASTIVRVNLAGDVVAVQSYASGVDGFRPNGIAVSSDGQTIYVTGTTPNRGGVVLAVPAFGAGNVTPSLVAQAQAAGATDMTGFGTFIFSHNATEQEGLGPMFNSSSCAGCHTSPSIGGEGVLPGQRENLVARQLPDGSFDTLDGLHGGPTARAHELASCDFPTGIPPLANVSSLRNAQTLRGNGLMDTIQAGDIINNLNNEPADVRGHVNVLADGRVGKFGWKANVATLPEFMADAFRNEIGLTNSVVREDELHACGADVGGPELDGLPLTAAVAFINTLDPPNVVADQGATCQNMSGFSTFKSVGCAGCHSPTLKGRGIKIPLYSDMALHDMGPALADSLPMASAAGNEWRSAPLWGLSQRTVYLHDARANTIDAAVAAHGGQAAAAAAAYQALTPSDKQALLAFLGCI